MTELGRIIYESKALAVYTAESVHVYLYSSTVSSASMIRLLQGAKHETITKTIQVVNVNNSYVKLVPSTSRTSCIIKLIGSASK